MKSILLPTDFSKNSVNAIHYAMNLFENEECKFYILNVQKASSFLTDDMMVVSSSATLYNTIVDAAKKSIANIISKIEKKYANNKHEFHSLVDYDNFIDSIIQISEKFEIDMVVMGTKGAAGLEKMIFGSNTVRVMQRCNMPVLAIPDGCKYVSLNSIAFATTNLKQFEIEDFKPLCDILAIEKSQLDILHLADQNHIAYDAFDNMTFFNTNFAEANHEYIDTNSKDLFNAVHNYLINNNIKMLSIVNKQHSFLQRLFTRHDVETFGFNIDIPLLVMQSSS